MDINSSRFQYRAKTPTGKVVYGLLRFERIQMLHDSRYEPILVNAEGITCHVIPETLQQCTSYHDADGFMLYEGDVLEHRIRGTKKSNKYVIVWGEPIDSIAGFFMKNGDHYEQLHEKQAYYGYIVGNILENPEFQTL